MRHGTRREQQERKFAEMERKEAEIEEREALRFKRKIALQQQKEEEERKRRQQEENEERERKKAAEAEKRRIAEEERKRAVQIQKQREEQARQERAAQERAAKTLKFSFTIDPNDSKEIAVAQVHEGDQFEITVQRQNGVNQKLFIGLLPLKAYQMINSGSSRSQRTVMNQYFLKGPHGAPTLVSMPIRDHENLVISNQLNAYHPNSRYLNVSNDQNGSIFFIGTGLSKGSFITDMFGSRKGSFNISVQIYSANRWGIYARRLL
jgi:hypothetical protein